MGMFKRTRYMPKRRPAPKGVKELSEGEETFALHCRSEDLYPMREVEVFTGRAWRFDFWFPNYSLAVEIEGGTSWGKSRHSRGEGFELDCRKYNAAAIAGIKLLRFSTAMVQSREAIETVLGVMGRPSRLQGPC